MADIVVTFPDPPAPPAGFEVRQVCIDQHPPQAFADHDSLAFAVSEFSAALYKQIRVHVFAECGAIKAKCVGTVNGGGWQWGPWHS